MLEKLVLLGISAGRMGRLVLLETVAREMMLVGAL
jgi:hypothetical protein